MDRGGHPTPQANPARPVLAEACMCGGTIRVEVRAEFSPEEMDTSIRDAVRIHQGTPRHQAYLAGGKYLPD